MPAALAPSLKDKEVGVSKRHDGGFSQFIEFKNEFLKDVDSFVKVWSPGNHRPGENGEQSGDLLDIDILALGPLTMLLLLIRCFYLDWDD